MDAIVSGARRAARLLIRAYQLSFSALVGRQCRHWPSCSAYADEAIARHGLWFGGWMATGRLCRCRPLGTAGVDLVPRALPGRARWFAPWRAASWRRCHVPADPPGREGEDEVNAPSSSGSAGPR